MKTTVVLTKTVATLLGKEYATMAKLAVMNAEVPRASIVRLKKHIPIKTEPEGDLSSKLKQK